MDMRQSAVAFGDVNDGRVPYGNINAVYEFMLVMQKLRLLKRFEHRGVFIDARLNRYMAEVLVWT